MVNRNFSSNTLSATVVDETSAAARNAPDTDKDERDRIGPGRQDLDSAIRDRRERKSQPRGNKGDEKLPGEAHFP